MRTKASRLKQRSEMTLYMRQVRRRVKHFRRKTTVIKWWVRFNLVGE